MIVIYSILNKINNKSYIGKTNDFYTRKRKHLEMLRRGKHFNQKLQNSFNLHGESSYEFFPLIEIREEEDWEYYEKTFINLFDTINNGYNISIGGKGGNFDESERNLKQSISNKNRVENIIQIDPTTLEVIAEYESLNHASRETGFPLSHISSACNRKIRHASGYCWSFEKDYSEFWKPVLIKKQRPFLVLNEKDEFIFLGLSLVELQENIKVGQPKIKELLISGKKYFNQKLSCYIKIIELSEEEYYAYPVKKPVSTRTFRS